MKRYESIKDVSSNDMLVSDGNDTANSSFVVIKSENEVKNKFSKLYFYIWHCRFLVPGNTQKILTEI